jgi:hypothetical protein
MLREGLLCKFIQSRIFLSSNPEFSIHSFTSLSLASTANAPFLESKKAPFLFLIQVCPAAAVHGVKRDSETCGVRTGCSRWLGEDQRLLLAGAPLPVVVG